jgi:hypothetical protein
MAKMLDIHAGTTTEILLLNIFHALEEILKELKKEGKDDQPRKTKKVNTK